MNVVMVRIPTPLRRFTAGADEVSVEGRSVGEVLQELVARHQDLSHHLFDTDGGIRKFINIYVNDRNVSSLDGLDTAVDNGTVLTIVPAVAGGRR
ncbi:MAG: ubiquitin-like small modifier protein 1 [Thermoanaerobaculia bacterium]